MKNIKLSMVVGLVAGALVFAATPAGADHKEEQNHPGLHKGFEKKHYGWSKGKGHDRNKKGGDEWSDAREHRRGAYYDGRSHANKKEIRRDIKDFREARKDVREDRAEIQKYYKELEKDKAELRRDIRNGASRKEIRQDQREIRQDLQKISQTKKELRQSQNKLEGARRELREGLRNR
jgi:DNA repair exonuclease SbcCD ATPase subunit